MMKILKIIFWPLIMLKNILDPNFWAYLIGDTSGLYDKAKGSKFRQWADNLTGWRWWLWQILAGVGIVLVAEFCLSMLGLTMLPWRM